MQPIICAKIIFSNKYIAKAVVIKPFRISSIKVIKAITLLPDLRTLVAPGFFEPYSLGSGNLKNFDNNIELLIEPKI